MPHKANSKRPRPELCSSTTKSGEPCNRSPFVASDGTTYEQCRWHLPKGACPELDAARKANAIAGGRTKKYRAVVSLEQQDINSASDIAVVLASALKALNDGELEPKRAQALTGVSGALLKALELQLEETRLAEIEAKLGIGDGRVSSTVSATDQANAGEWVIQGKNGAES